MSFCVIFDCNDKTGVSWSLAMWSDVLRDRSGERAARLPGRVAATPVCKSPDLGIVACHQIAARTSRLSALGPTVTATQ